MGLEDIPRNYRSEDGQWNIRELLDGGLQPWDDLTDEEIAGLVKGIGTGPLLDPVTVSANGRLLDGHQRLRALLKKKRTTIGDIDVRVAWDVTTAGQELETAVMLNVQRRHLTLEQKAKKAGELMAMGWSYARIAKAFGVSRPAIAQWFAKFPQPVPDTVTGEDGKTYTRNVPGLGDEGGPEPDPDHDDGNPQPNPPVPAWNPSKGSTMKAVKAAKRSIRSRLVELPGTGLTALQRASVEQELVDLLEACEDALSALGAPPAEPVGEPVEEPVE